MTALNRYLAKFCQWIGAGLLFAIMAVTMLDVITRTLFALSDGEWSWYVRGSVELISFGLLLALLAGFAAFIEHAQIMVDVFSARFSNLSQATISAMTLLLYAVIASVLTLGLLENMISANQYGDITQDLGLPLSYIYGAASVLSAILTVRALLCALTIIISRRGDDNFLLDLND